MKHQVVSALAALALATTTAVHEAAPAPTDNRTIVHVLNRIGFGAAPGDIEQVRAIGVERYIDQQLHPERVPDPGMDARLSHLETVGMSSRQISEQYEQPLLEARRERRQQQGGQPAEPPPGPDGRPAPQGRNGVNRPQQAANTVVVELSEQKLLRAIYSERQLQEVLVDFWFNHFNVDARKGRVRFMLTEFEREAIRPHVLGSFRELLEATAKSPAMLFYLDNFMSADPNGAASNPMASRPGSGRGRLLFPQTQRPEAQQARMMRGLNENYARELMELHTLGVDGGYTQKDVTEVARAFTGWTIGGPGQARLASAGGFSFSARLHDEGEKTVLGNRIKAGGGIEDGERVLDILAAHPSTARFIATKLARRFISDTPPQSVVDRAAARFRETKGDLREVTRTILLSSEFLAPDAYRAKVKTPLEFVVSVARATGAEVTSARALVGTLRDLGMPLYQCQPPTGYKDTADGWTNTGALVNRMNFAQQVGAGQLPGVSLGARPADGPTPTAFVTSAMGGDLSDTTSATIARATTEPERLALMLGSPEFQRR